METIINQMNEEKETKALEEMQKWKEENVIEYVENNDTVPYQWYSWGPPLCQFQITDEELDIVKKQIEKDEDGTNYAHQLAGAVETQTGFSDLTRYNIFNTIARYFYAYTRHAFLNHSVMAETEEFNVNHICQSLECRTMWVNHMVAGDYNPLHTHDEQMSFVLYTEVPEGLDAEIENSYNESTRRVAPGAIEFRYGTSNIHPLSCIIKRSFPPKTGELFIFPNYLEHQVYPFKSEGVRTSISGNLRYNRVYE